MTLSYSARPYEGGLPDPDRHAALYADVPAKRFGAWIIDSLAIVALTLLAIPFTAFTAVFFLPLLWLVVGLLYRMWSLSARSATPGMRLMAIELRNGDGAPLTPAEAVVHTVLYSVCFTMVFPMVISAGLMMGSARGQGLPDLALGTTALNRGR